MLAHAGKQPLGERNVAAVDGCAHLLQTARAVGIVVIVTPAVAPAGIGIAVGIALRGGGGRFALLLDLIVRFVDLFHFFLRKIGKRVIVVVVRVIFAGKVAVSTLDLLVSRRWRDIQDLIGVVHTVSSIFSCFMRKCMRRGGLW